MNGSDEFYSVDEIRRRMSCSTIAFWRYRPICEDSLAEMARAGIRKIELLESRDQFDMADAGSMRLIGNACKSCGIEIVAYHAWQTDFDDVQTESQRIERVDLCRRQIDTMLELGGAAWGPHGFAIDSKIVKSYRELARHVEGTDAIVMIENFGTGSATVEERMRFLNEVDHPQVKLILDIGHESNSDGQNPMTIPGGPNRILELCAHRLGHLHLHGFKDGHDHFPPFVPGDGIQWVELFRKLYEINYPGLFNFEPLGDSVHPGSLAAVGRAPERIVEMNATK